MQDLDLGEVRAFLSLLPDKRFLATRDIIAVCSLRGQDGVKPTGMGFQYGRLRVFDGDLPQRKKKGWTYVL